MYKMRWWFYLLELFWELQEILNIKYLSQFLARSINSSLLILYGATLAIFHCQYQMEKWMSQQTRPVQHFQSLQQVFKSYQLYLWKFSRIFPSFSIFTITALDLGVTFSYFDFFFLGGGIIAYTQCYMVFHKTFSDYIFPLLKERNCFGSSVLSFVFKSVIWHEPILSA